jgi:hypothetical protein
MQACQCMGAGTDPREAINPVALRSHPVLDAIRGLYQAVDIWLKRFCLAQIADGCG